MLLVDGGREASMNRLPGNESRFNYLSGTQMDALQCMGCWWLLPFPTSSTVIHIGRRPATIMVLNNYVDHYFMAELAASNQKSNSAIMFYG